MIAGANIRIRGIAGLRVREFRDRHWWPMMERMGRHWFAHMLPDHFTTEGEREYRYQPRSRRYNLRKAKQKGHRKPLVYSGQLRRHVLAQFRLARGRKGVLRVRLTGARGVNRLPVQYRDELTRPSLDDHRELIDLGNQVIGQSVRDEPAERVITIQ